MGKILLKKKNNNDKVVHMYSTILPHFFLSTWFLLCYRILYDDLGILPFFLLTKSTSILVRATADGTLILLDVLLLKALNENRAAARISPGQFSPSIWSDGSVLVSANLSQINAIAVVNNHHIVNEEIPMIRCCPQKPKRLLAGFSVLSKITRRLRRQVGSVAERLKASFL